ncbi:putative increased recombination centers protein 19 [[Candida] jaroonii]|uniref:Increased recombination centers protein 19 n=1 Tax=[Candida] jaroonii TaxID=467808 RepID=A0ACA9Y0W6_9ASCO|nr:putative increased recombination centers protein 19 [[Candida] jaroonii]
MIDHIFNRNGLFVLKAINKPVTYQYLQQLPSDKSKYLCLYKRFYRLRNYISNDTREINRYVDTLRWKFTREDFNKRLAMIDQSPLNNDDMFERFINTLSFVNNATVALPENIPEKPINFIQDVKKPQRMERSIIKTILDMQLSKPDDIKYDTSYKWFKETEELYENFPEEISKKNFKSTLSKIGIIGFHNYELNLMMLNNSYNLML